LKNQTDKIAWLEKNLQVDFDPSPEYMRLSLAGDDGDDMKTIMDAIKTVYIKEVISKDSMQRLMRLHQLEEVHRKYAMSLDEYRKKLGGIAEDLGSTDPATNSLRERFAQERLTAAQHELLQLESEMRRGIIESRRQDEKLKNSDRIDIPQEAVDAAIKSDPRYTQLAANVTLIENSIDEIKSKLAPGTGAEALAKQEEKLTRAKKELADYASAIRPTIIARIKESAIAENKRLMMVLRDRMAMSTDIKKAIEEDITRCTQVMHRSNVAQLDIESIRRDMKHLENTAELVQQQIEELKPELDAPSRVSVWEEPAVVPATESDHRLIYSSIALAAVLAFGLAFVTLIELALTGR
jgi:hypothetical protein